MIDKREMQKNKRIKEMREELYLLNKYRRSDEYKRDFKKKFVLEKFGADFFVRNCP